MCVCVCVVYVCVCVNVISWIVIGIHLIFTGRTERLKHTNDVGVAIQSEDTLPGGGPRGRRPGPAGAAHPGASGSILCPCPLLQDTAGVAVALVYQVLTAPSLHLTSFYYLYLTMDPCTESTTTHLPASHAISCQYVGGSSCLFRVPDTV